MQSIYTEHNGKICVAAADLLAEGICTKPLWDKWMREAKQLEYTTRAGGNGRPSLIELTAIPSKYREQIIDKFGNPEKQHNALEQFFAIDSNARAFYDSYRNPETGKSLEKYQIERYTINASMLNALAQLREARVLLTKVKGNPKRDLKQGLTNDAIAFNHILKAKYQGLQHNLPKNPRKLMEKLAEYLRLRYACLIDKRGTTANAQVVTPEMLELWNCLFAGQKHKPSHYEVHFKYSTFLMGKLEIVNPATGEVFDPTKEYYKPVSERTVLNHLGEWVNRIGVFKKRSGNRKTYMDLHTPSARMLRPTPGAIISVDDFQPPFKYASGGGNRIWFYIAQDLGSTAITAWVYGKSKEGIIEDFYKEVLKNYTNWGINLPYEIECEAALNSSYVNTILSPGVMFQKARVLPNKPRAKRIERTIRDLRLQYASKHPAFIARHNAKDENYQTQKEKEVYISIEEIVEFELRVIEDWNNELHPDQAQYPRLSRWDVFLRHQNPNLTPTNWTALLPHIGKRTPSSMNMGRIQLQGLQRVVGFNGQVALGEDLLRIMNEIEGCEVDVFWWPTENDEVAKAMVYNKSGRCICELLDDLPFHRSEIDQTEQCRKNMQLYFAYEKTVDGHANQVAKSVSPVVVIEKEIEQQRSFIMPGLKRYEAPAHKQVEILPDVTGDEEPITTRRSTGLNSDNF